MMTGQAIAQLERAAAAALKLPKVVLGMRVLPVVRAVKHSVPYR